MHQNPEPDHTKNPQAVPRGHEAFNEVLGVGVKLLALAPGAKGTKGQAVISWGT